MDERLISSGGALRELKGKQQEGRDRRRIGRFSRQVIRKGGRKKLNVSIKLDLPNKGIFRIAGRYPDKDERNDRERFRGQTERGRGED